VILYYNPLSPYAFKVRVLLDEHQVSYELKTVRFHAQRAELLTVNPRGEIPVLVDGAEVISDSPIICEYLARRHGCSRLHPGDPRELARALAVQKFADTQLDAALFVLVLIRHLQPELAVNHPAAAEGSSRLLERVFGELERLLSERSYFAGEFSLADVAVIHHVATARALGHGPSRERWPGLNAWARRVVARPSVQQALAEAAQESQASAAMSDPFFTPKLLSVRGDRIEALLRVGLGPWLLSALGTGTAHIPEPV
jgi:glutathione S-transferase